ncbi:MAG: alpha/beta fold hydrolase [Candidatus Tectomicrobia bacterium]|uniref:Alpha/beta fold hydrolase n=1 Tax=Tectimicrobiota bacterium TaxID=2528274 RepID=A0A932CQA4_UNCTE|nr:alpha/beta fold hydrolase [Candidatus Tectomicrobia bacterium]
MEKRVVYFYSEGSRLEGDLFLPADLRPGEKRPGIVVCHGFTGIRELILPEYARVFTEAGYVSLTFDYRGFGGSEGSKWRLIPLDQIEDIRNAITFLQAQAEVDPERIGVWGTSFGGAHAPYVAGVDARVKVAVGQVGFGDGERFVQDVRSYSERVELLRQLEEDRRIRVLSGEGGKLDPLELALRDPQSRAFLPEAIKAYPQMRCELSWETLEKTLEYKPIDVVDRISPRALLLVGAKKDTICPIEGYQKLYERAREPKRLAILPITHYEIYGGQWFEESSRLAREWFDRFLK